MPPQSPAGKGVVAAGMAEGVAVAGTAAEAVDFMDLLRMVACPPWVMGGVAMH